MGAITAALKALAALLGIGQKRQELVNSPEMQANAKAGTDQKLKEDAAKVIANQDAKAAAESIAE